MIWYLITFVLGLSCAFLLSKFTSSPRTENEVQKNISEKENNITNSTTSDVTSPSSPKQTFPPITEHQVTFTKKTSKSTLMRRNKSTEGFSAISPRTDIANDELRGSPIRSPRTTPKKKRRTRARSTNSKGSITPKVKSTLPSPKEDETATEMINLPSALTIDLSMIHQKQESTAPNFHHIKQPESAKLRHVTEKKKTHKRSRSDTEQIKREQKADLIRTPTPFRLQLTKSSKQKNIGLVLN